MRQITKRVRATECTCLSSTGSASGDFTGTGFATLDIIVTDDSSAMCQDFNAAMFIIGPKDLEEVDFSGLLAMT